MSIEQYVAPSALAEQMEYARAVQTAAMLPDAYRGKPADIMLAVGLGQSMGLSPAESLYRIAVIKGKPTASAELIASNVRKAGHRLRTTVATDGLSATASIWRADDPEFEHTITRDMTWAQSMGLASNDNYRKQAATMLANRAITAVARLACPEALYGVAYSSDEMFDIADATPTQPTTSANRMRAALGTQVTVEQVTDSTPAANGDPTVATVEPDTASVPATGEPAGVDPVTKAQLAKLGAGFKDVGLPDRTSALAFVADVIGRQIESRNDLSKDEASQVIDAIDAELAQRQEAVQ